MCMNECRDEQYPERLYDSENENNNHCRSILISHSTPCCQTYLSLHWLFGDHRHAYRFKHCLAVNAFGRIRCGDFVDMFN